MTGLQLPARCPNCGTSPGVRVSPTLVNLLRSLLSMGALDSCEELETVQCARIMPGGRKCGTIYVLSASDFQEAR